MDLYGIMNNYDYPVGSDTPDAPWNQELSEEVEVLASLTVSRNLKVSMPKGYTQEDLVKETRKQLSLPELAKHMLWVEDDFEVIKE